MKRENSDFNLFNQPVKKKATPPKPAPAPKKSESPPPTDDTDEVAEVAKLDATEILKHIKIKHTELETMTGKAYDLCGLTKDGVKHLISNLGKEEEERIQKEKTDLENRVYQALGADTKIMTQKFKENKATKTRSGKTIAGRKKWISMQ